MVSEWTLTLCSDFVHGAHVDVGRVVGVGGKRLREAVHVQQLPVGHLTVRVEDLLTFPYGPHCHHLQTVLQVRKKGELKILGLNLAFLLPFAPL